jgi:hypothetical protein
MILAAVVDRLQAKGAFLASISEEGLELIITSGKTRFNGQEMSDELTRIVTENGELPEKLLWGEDNIFPLTDKVNGNSGTPNLLGLMGITGIEIEKLDPEQKESLDLLCQRASMALQDRQLQIEIFQSMENLTRHVDYIQKLRAKGRYDSEGVFSHDLSYENDDILTWVKDALTHYWGGPKFTENPLMKFKTVQLLAKQNEGNISNALRSLLKNAIEDVKPEGERKFTSEWILYNILEMKFLEGRKVREIALKLSMSEADLYRKQRVAIEAVAKAIMELEKGSDSLGGEVYDK